MAETIDLNTLTPQAVASGDKVLGVGSGGGLKLSSFEQLMEAVRANIQIGGRNLIPDTSKEWMQTYISGFSNIFISQKYEKFGLAAGDTVTLSADVNNTTSKTISLDIELMTDESHRFQYKSRRLAPGESGKLVATATLTPEFSIIRLRFSNPDGNTNAGGEYMLVRKLKFELGNIATDWTPAPENSWGGVSLRFADTYAGMQKGGRHERYGDIGECAEISPDSVLSFRDVDAVCRFLEYAIQGESGFGRKHCNEFIWISGNGFQSSQNPGTIFNGWGEKSGELPEGNWIVLLSPRSVSEIHIHSAATHNPVRESGNPRLVRHWGNLDRLVYSVTRKEVAA